MTSNSSQLAASVATENEIGGSSVSPRLGRLLAFARRFVVKDILGTVVTSFVLFGFLTLQGILLARMLGPDGRGQYATAVFYTQTLIYIGLFGTHFATARWSARRNQDQGALIGACRRLGTLTGITTMVVVGVLAFIGLPADKRYLAPLCLVCSLFLPFEHIRLLWLAIDQGAANFRRYNLSRFAAGIAFPLLLMAAWVCGATTPWTVAILFAMSPIVGLTYQLATQAKYPVEPQKRGPTPSKILKRGKPYALAVLVSDLCDRIDVFLFLWLTSFTAQGYYAAAVPAANLLLVIPIAVSVFAFNAGARRENRPTLVHVVKTSLVMLLVQILAAVMFAVVLEPLMVFVFGEDFRGAVPLALALLPAYALAGCGRVAEAFLQGRNKAILGVVTRLASAVVMCGFIYFTFDRYGELSIPWGATVGYLMSSIMLFAFILREVRSSGTAPTNNIAAGEA